MDLDIQGSLAKYPDRNTQFTIATGSKVPETFKLRNITSDKIQTILWIFFSNQLGIIVYFATQFIAVAFLSQAGFACLIF